MKRAQIPVTPELLGQMLCLPEGVKIDDCRFDLDSRCVVLAVTGDALPDKCDVSDGKRPPSLKPMYQKVDYKMVDWGQR